MQSGFEEETATYAKIEMTHSMVSGKPNSSKEKGLEDQLRSRSRPSTPNGLNEHPNPTVKMERLN